MDFITFIAYHLIARPGVQGFSYPILSPHRSPSSRHAEGERGGAGGRGGSVGVGGGESAPIQSDFSIWPIRGPADNTRHEMTKKKHRPPASASASSIVRLILFAPPPSSHSTSRYFSITSSRMETLVARRALPTPSLPLILAPHLISSSHIEPGGICKNEKPHKQTNQH